jgi:hypothetical protein
MPILNYRTEVPASKTVGEIQAMIAKAGCTRMMIEYHAGEPVTLLFEFEKRQYRLPCRHEAVLAALKKDMAVPRRLATLQHAQRVGWRIVKDWVEAQMAIISVGMVKADEIFLPYQITHEGATVYEVYREMDADRLLEVMR